MRRWRRRRSRKSPRRSSTLKGVMTEKKDEEMPPAEGAELVAEPADEKMEAKKEPEKPKKVFDVEWTETVKDDKRKKATVAPEIDTETAMLGLLVNNSYISCSNYEGLQQ